MLANITGNQIGALFVRHRTTQQVSSEWRGDRRDGGNDEIGAHIAPGSGLPVARVEVCARKMGGASGRCRKRGQEIEPERPLGGRMYSRDRPGNFPPGRPGTKVSVLPRTVKATVVQVQALEVR